DVNAGFRGGGVLAVQDTNLEVNEVKRFDRGIMPAQCLPKREVQRVRRTDAPACGGLFLIADLQTPDGFRFANRTSPHAVVDGLEEPATLSKRSQSQKLERCIGILKLITAVFQILQLRQETARRFRAPHEILTQVLRLETNVAHARLIAHENP